MKQDRAEKMMSRELKRLSAEQRAIVEKHLSSFPVRLGAIAKELGVDIKVSTMPTGISGQIARENDRYVIRVNRNEARERQRFTIGHELAHFLLHREIIDSSKNGITDNVLYRSGESERIEFEANRLAADLVMPMALVQERLRADFDGVVTVGTIESLAECFEVSKAAMEIRLSTFAEA
jgi:Zn-dependent peptidase ImmA (M78 family)